MKRAIDEMDFEQEMRLKGAFEKKQQQTENSCTSSNSRSFSKGSKISIQKLKSPMEPPYVKKIILKT